MAQRHLEEGLRILAAVGRREMAEDRRTVEEEPEGVVVSCIEFLEGDAGRLVDGVLKDSDGMLSVVDAGVAIPSLLFFLDRGLLLKGRRKDIWG